MLNTQTLQSIQAGTDEEVYSTTTRAALWMATGGYLAPWMPGETRYPGFRHYMEDQLQSSEGYLSRHKNGRDKSEKNE